MVGQRADSTDQDGAEDAPAAAVRILVVDDEESLCLLACKWLASLGFAPTGVQSAGEALARLRRESYDLLFTDIAMPGSMDGIALATRAKKDYPGLRVLLASAYAANLLVDHELPGGFLNKPYTKESLAAAVTGALSSQA